MSIRVLFCSLCAFCLLAVPSQAFAKSYKKEIRQAESLGQEIYNQDIAAWVVSDRLRDDFEAGVEIDSENMTGWISYAIGAQYRTVFVSKGPENPVVLYEALSQDRLVLAAGPPATNRLMTEKELGLWRARELALTHEFERCDDYPSINTSVVEKPKGDGYYAYLFASSQAPNLMVLGKHYRLDINAAADTIENAYAFTNSCFGLPVNLTEGAPAALMATHLVAPYPQEHHVFANLSWDIDLYVSTQDSQLWKISDGGIKKIKD